MTAPSLGALLANARAKVAADTAAKEAKSKAKLKRPDAPLNERDAEALIRSAELEWIPVALIYKQFRYQCTCGHERNVPDGLYIYSEHSRLANSSRLVRPRSESEFPEGLPRRVAFETRPVFICPSCFGDYGFITEHKPRVFGLRTVPAMLNTNPDTSFVAEWQAKRATSPEESDHDAD